MAGDFNFDLDFVLLFTELVFDMLSATKTLENSSFDHDAHLGRKRLCFFH